MSYNFSELDALTDRLIDAEMQAYDLPYYIEPLLEGATLIDLLKAYLNDAITHKNASRIESSFSEVLPDSNLDTFSPKTKVFCSW